MREWLSEPHPLLYTATSAIYIGMSIAAASVGEDLSAAFFGAAGLFMGWVTWWFLGTERD